MELSFDDAFAIAKGCHDYGGGYHDEELVYVYHHGIQTVINALMSAKEHGLKDMQVKVLHTIGSKEYLTNTGNF
ncbi:MAG: hypothetical protein GX892_14385 [Thermoanaerobacteraceae bacterium]|nr:hypothetical protein [Thermoanaerobacteraceae bacterium]